jgi:YVTN family beta-propeller protein
MTGFFFVASALHGAHAEQHNPDRAVTFGYVPNANDNTVSVIDTATNSVVATINLPVGAIPKGVATTPDGTHAYVINDGNFTVSVIDTANNTVVTTIPADDPSGVAITPDGTHAYVTSRSENTVSVIDIASNTVVAMIPVGSFPSGVAITPDGTHPPRVQNSVKWHTAERPSDNF